MTFFETKRVASCKIRVTESCTIVTRYLEVCSSPGYDPVFALSVVTSIGIITSHLKPPPCSLPITRKVWSTPILHCNYKPIISNWRLILNDFSIGRLRMPSKMENINFGINRSSISLPNQRYELIEPCLVIYLEIATQSGQELNRQFKTTAL